MPATGRYRLHRTHHRRLRDPRLAAWDLLDALARGSEAVLGGVGSLWRKPRQALELLLGEAVPPNDEVTQWAWMRNPLPPASEGPDYQSLRRVLRLADQDAA